MKRFIIVSVVAVLAIIVWRLNIERKPRFTISKETTYVTGPVDADGYVDCTMALNERLREGVST